MSWPENILNGIWEHWEALEQIGLIKEEKSTTQQRVRTIFFLCGTGTNKCWASAKIVFSSFTVLNPNKWLIYFNRKRKGPDKDKNSRVHMVQWGNFLSTWSLSRVLKGPEAINAGGNMICFLEMQEIRVWGFIAMKEEYQLTKIGAYSTV